MNKLKQATLKILQNKLKKEQNPQEQNKLKQAIEKIQRLGGK